MKDMDQTGLAARQFGETAENYLVSAVHATGADLDRLTELARGLSPRALDLGCGAGHAGFALARGGAASVVAFDPSKEMLGVVAQEAKQRGYANIATRQGVAEDLPFDDASFDLVVSRFSAHHWSGVPAALGEVRRILAPGGALVFIDVIAPESALLDTTLQTLELLRDMSHVRNYRLSDWRAMLAAARFPGVIADAWKISLQFDSWIARIATPARRVDALRAVLKELPREAREYFDIAADGSFTIDAAWLEVSRGA
jgi:SAM-dependent methyltransferase